MCTDGWPLWCLLAACGSTAQLCENHTRWGAALSAPLVSMLAAAGLAAAGVIPTDCAAYGAVWRYVMPLAAACFLLETDVTRLASDGGPVLASFALGACGMVLGALAGWSLLRGPLGPCGAQLAACLCASYVGGSVNFAAVAMALQLPPSSLPVAMAADNLGMAAFLALLMAVPVRHTAAASAASAASAPSDTAPIAAIGATKAIEAPFAETPPPITAPNASSTSPPSPSTSPTPPPPVTAESLSLTLTAAAAACAGSQALAAALGAAPLTLLFMAVLAAGIAAAAQGLRGLLTRRRRRLAGDASDGGTPPQGPVFAGAAQLGSCLMPIFFAVIGASAGSLQGLSGAGSLLAFLAVMVGVHWGVMAAVGERLLRLPREALLIGSNANIGGSATAAAMAAARGWQPLVQPAMLAGSMGYAVGTAAGLLVARLAGAAA